jgi:hypothetical protein
MATVATEAPLVCSHSQGIQERYPTIKWVRVSLTSQMSKAVTAMDMSVIFATKKITVEEKMSLKLLAIV